MAGAEVGGVLSDVGLGLMKGLMGPSWDEEKAERQQKFRKGESDLQTAETQRKLNEAHAQYYKLGPRTSESKRILKLKDGSQVEYNLVTGEQKPIDDPTTKPLKGREQVDLALIGILEKRFGKPLEELSQEEWNDPAVADTVELLRLRDSIISGPTGITRREWVPKTPPPVKGQPVPAVDTAGRPVVPTAPGDKTAASPDEKAVSPKPAPEHTPAAPGAVRLGKTTPEMEDAIAAAHQQYPEVRPELIRAVIGRESSYNPYITSPKGAGGLMQLMPGTAKEMQVADVFDVRQNIMGGTRYLAQMLKHYGGSEALALAAYNGGPGRFEQRGKDLAKMPPETQSYVPAVLQRSYQMRWEKMTQPDVDKQWQVLSASPTARPEDKEAGRQAYTAIFGKEPPGTAATPAAGTPAAAPAAAPAQPAKTPAVPGRPTTEKPGEVPTIPVYQTEPQRQAEIDKREDQRLQREAAANAAEQTRISQANHQLAQRRLDEELKERDRANARRDRAAAYKAEQNIVQETKDLRGQIDGAEETMALIQELRRYVAPETVGVRGAVTQLWQQLKGQFEAPGSSRVRLTGEAAEMQRRVNSLANRHQKDAQTWQDEENSLAREQGRAPTTIYIPNYSRFDPRMTFIDYLREVVAYSQARAMNGVGRLTDQDLVHAKKALMIDDWKIPAQQMQAALGYVEKELKAKKARDQVRMAGIEKRLRQHAGGAAGAETETVEPSKEP